MIIRYVRSIGLGLLTAACLTGVSAAQDRSATPQAGSPLGSVETDPLVNYTGRWIVAPRVIGNDLPDAVLEGVSGEATVACTVRMDGRMADCRPVAETPRRRGFGLAAVKVARRGRMQPPGPEFEDHPRLTTMRITFDGVN